MNKLIFVALYLVLGLTGLCFAQLPDAPSTICKPWDCLAPGEREGSWTYLWDGRRAASNHEVLHDYKGFWAPTALGLSAVIMDAEVSHAYHSHFCVEGGYDLPRNATRAQLYKQGLIPWAALSGLGYFFRKARAPWPIYWSMQAFGAGVHAKGIASWYQNCPT